MLEQAIFHIEGRETNKLLYKISYTGCPKIQRQAGTGWEVLYQL